MPTAPALVTRARLERLAGDRTAALADVTRALGFDAKFPEGLLERGRLRLLAGDIKNARLDFLDAALLAKSGPIVDAAQDEMAKLDISNR